MNCYEQGKIAKQKGLLSINEDTDFVNELLLSTEKEKMKKISEWFDGFYDEIQNQIHTIDLMTRH